MYKRSYLWLTLSGGLLVAALTTGLMLSGTTITLTIDQRSVTTAGALLIAWWGFAILAGWDLRDAAEAEARRRIEELHR